MTSHDIVLRGGRVIDPETGLDAVCDVAVTGGRITELGSGLGPGATALDVAGQVVTAGFIDLHSHTADVAGLRLRALDGVTTALELEAGVSPVEPANRGGRGPGAPWNAGVPAAWGHAPVEAACAAARAGRARARP